MEAGKVSEVYYSSVEVIIQTMNDGIIDVSEDVQKCSVTRKTDAVSSASITLTNYSNYRNGRYNSVIHVGDRIHVEFIKNSTKIPAFTGRVFQVPVMSFNEGSYTFLAYDIINDLQYMYWDPYSTAALKRYTLSGPKLTEWAAKKGYNDSGIGVALKDFMTAKDGVCHLPSAAVKIAKFPDTKNTMENIVKAAMKNGKSGEEGKTAADETLEDWYIKIFGGNKNSDYVKDSSSGDGSGSSKDKDKDDSASGSTPMSQNQVAPQILANVLKWMHEAVDWGAGNDKWASPAFAAFKIGGKWKSWCDHDGARHYGKFGMSAKQLDIYCSWKGDYKDWDANRGRPGSGISTRPGEDSQMSAIQRILHGCNSGSGYRAIWYYYHGFKLDYDKNGNIKWDNGITGFKLFGNEFKKKGDWEKYIDKWYKTASERDSSNKKLYEQLNSKAELMGQNGSGKSVKSAAASVMSLSSVSAVKAQSKASAKASQSRASSSSKSSSSSSSSKSNAKADEFEQWIKRTEGVHQYTDTGQCWDLWHSYYNNFLKLSGSQWVIQPGSGNPGFAQYAYRRSSYYKQNFELIGDFTKLQAGDVAFWRSSAKKAHSAQYGHVSIIIGNPSGDSVMTLSQWASRNPFREPEYNAGFTGALRPTALGGVPGKVSGSAGAASGSDSGSSDSGSGGDWDSATNTGLKLFKYFTYGFDTNAIIESAMLQGDLRMANDVSCLEYVSSCCKASMRTYMSLPDGSFAAFVPDWFGKMFPASEYHNIIEIPKTEVISFNIDFNKASYVSHLFLTTNETIPDPANASALGVNMDVLGKLGSIGNTVQLMMSSGVITLDYQGNNLLSLMDISCTGISNTDPNACKKLMNRWGVSVKQEHDNYIQDSRLTAISALYRFLRYWANCFKSMMQITFRPEILPGLRLHFADAGVTLYVEQVTHSWSATEGGTTTVTVNSPVNDQGKAGVAETK